MSFADLLSSVFTGSNLALLGIFLATALPGWGSAKGVGIVGQAGNALLSEDDSAFGSVIILEALPATQGIYGLVTSLLIMAKTGAFGGISQLTLAQGGYLLLAAMPIALVGLISAQHQAKVAATGINLIAKQKGALGKAITNAALVETYAILALLVSLLLVIAYK